MATNRKLTETEQDFMQTLIASLPPVIARKEGSRFLGGVVASQTLNNADASGEEGPEKSYRVGRCMLYRTDSLVRWIVDRYGISTVAGSKESLGLRLWTASRVASGIKWA